MKEDKFTEHIKNREMYEKPCFYLRKLLETSNLESYCGICGQRIADAGLFDQNHILLDLTRNHMGDILLDNLGLKKCGAVLKHFLPDDQYKKIVEYADALTIDRALKDQLMHFLKEKSFSQIKIMIEEAEESLKNLSDQEEDVKHTLSVLHAELEARKLGNFMRLKGKTAAVHFISSIQLNMRARFIGGILQKCEDDTQEYTEKMKRNADRRAFMKQYSWIVYLDAFERASRTYKRRSLDTREVVLKYVYLGVKRYGKHYKDQIKEKTYTTVKTEYAALSSIMNALEKLTPAELTQMFPIAKEYDGAKWGMKDYFYTTNWMKKLDQEKPIGEQKAIEAVLWDYENHDLRCFFIHYTGCISDLYVYCDDKEKHEDFHEKLNSSCTA